MSTLEAPTRSYSSRGGAALAPAPHGPGRRAPSSRERPRRPGHLRVVAPAGQIRRRVTPATGVVLTALVFVVLFAIAIANTVLVQGQIHLDGLDDQLTSEQARYQDLRKSVAEMESPERVVAAAKELGMVAPDDLVYLQPAATDTTPGSGQGANPGASDEIRSDWSAMKPLLEAPAQ